MASAIHHGPPGSYKSFTCIQRRAIAALESGRVVITNVRGFTSVDRVADNFPDIKFPESADILWINTEVKEGKELLARWFHWAPFGAMIIIDECQVIYPNRRAFKLESLDRRMVPAGYQVQDLAIEIDDDYTGQTTIVNRPADVETAFTMQRHFQWDVYLSTPHIDMVNDLIRQVAETAYRHKSLSGKLPKPLAKLFGLYETWYEFQHNPSNNGQSLSHAVGKPRKYKADERVYKCYRSTATGEHTASQADQSILGDPKLRFVLVVLVLAIGVLVWSLLGFSKAHSKPAFDSSVAPATSSPVKADSPPARPVLPARDRGRVDNVNYQSGGSFFDFLGFRLLQIAYQRLDDTDHSRLSFLADSKDGLKPVDYIDLYRAGVRASVHGLCKIKLIAPDGSMLDLGCSSNIVFTCSASLESPDFVVRRNCRRYGDKPEPVKVPQNALVAVASDVLPASAPAP